MVASDFQTGGLSPAFPLISLRMTPMKTPTLHFRAAFCPAIFLFLAILTSLGIAQAATIKTIASTVPANGDINPYGVAVVPTTTGSLMQGNILISNFNNSANLQGTG